MSKTKIKKLEKEVKDATQKADEDVKRANKGYDNFMSYYSDYKSDLKRRGMPTVQPTSGKLRRSSRKTKDSDRQSEGGNKETEETNS